MKRGIPYSEQLKDPRWQKKRLEVLNAAGWQCEDCQNNSETLEVHHSIYFKNHAPWEYGSNALMCVCSTCHRERQEWEEEARIVLALVLRITPKNEIINVRDALWSMFHLRRGEK